MKIVSLVVASTLVLSSASLLAASGREDSVERLQAAAEVLHSIQEAPDHGIPNSVLDDTKCIIVVPHLIKGGFVFGAKHGRGVATCRTADGWSAPAFISVGGGSWGLQIGVEEVDLVMLVMNDRGVQHLLSSKFELSGEGAVVEQDNDSTWAIYDHEPSFRNVLSGRVAVPESADSFLKEVNHDSARAREEASK